MPKRNIFLRIALLMLCATLATSGVFYGSGTFAKYIASAPVNVNATVAKFDVLLKDEKGDFKHFQDLNGNTVSIALFDDFGTGRASIYCTDPWIGTEFQVYPGDYSNKGYTPTKFADGKLIAPGTMGKMEFTFRNLSEVSVRFYLDPVATTFTGVNNAKLIFFANSAEGTPPNPQNETVFGAISSITGASGTASIVIHPGQPDKTVNFWWCWPFHLKDAPSDAYDLISAQDLVDTALGETKALPPRCTASFLIKAEQID